MVRRFGTISVGARGGAVRASDCCHGPSCARRAGAGCGVALSERAAREEESPSDENAGPVDDRIVGVHKMTPISRPGRVQVAQY